MTFAATVLTLYPEMFPGPLGVSLAGRAHGRGQVGAARRCRSATSPPTSTAPSTIRPQAAGRGWCCKCRCAGGGDGSCPRGPARRADPRHDPARETASPRRACANWPHGPGVIILCGRFEGFDERIFDGPPEIEEVSVGDIVLSGGEPAALMLLDACIRLLPGVMGAASSGAERVVRKRPARISRTIPDPRNGKGARSLKCCDRGIMRRSRRGASYSREVDTRLRRPDLWERHEGARVQPASGARRKKKDWDQ